MILFMLSETLVKLSSTGQAKKFGHRWTLLLSLVGKPSPSQYSLASLMVIFFV
jgi:hypothetical protein